MSGSIIEGRGRRCPVCGRGILRPRLISEIFGYGEDGDSVVVRTQDVPVEDCHSCGESFSGPEGARIRHEAVGRALGLLTPVEIRSIRERLGHSPEHFARLIGVTSERLAQWEEGSVWQDRPSDRLMRLLANRSENAAYLESLMNGQANDAEEPGPEVQPQGSGVPGEAADAQQRDESPAKGRAIAGRYGGMAARRLRPIGKPLSSPTPSPHDKADEPEAGPAPTP